MAATLKSFIAREFEERLVGAASCLDCDAAIGQRCLDARGRRTLRACWARYTFGRVVLLADLACEIELRGEPVDWPNVYADVFAGAGS